MQHNRPEDAKKALARVRGTTVEAQDPYVEHDFLEIQESIELEAKLGKGTWADTLGPRLRKRTILGILLQALQQLTGANYFFYVRPRPAVTGCARI
jgi:SP family sugar:H+ symporter-like MFS transporter